MCVCVCDLLLFLHQVGYFGWDRMVWVPIRSFPFTLCPLYSHQVGYFGWDRMVWVRDATLYTLSWPRTATLAGGD